MQRHPRSGLHESEDKTRSGRRDRKPYALSQSVRTLLLYSAGYNNLSPVLKDDIDDICSGYLPEGYSFNDNLLVFAHHTVSDYNYRDEVQPCLIRIYRDRDGIAVRDTVRTWPEGTSAVDPETLRSVLEYVRDNYPSEEYGMIFSSHATGWLPPNFPRNGSTILMSGGSGTGKRSGKEHRAGCRDQRGNGCEGFRRRHTYGAGVSDIRCLPHWRSRGRV